jgi:hypothetical protein
MCSSGRERMNVHGIRIHAHGLREEGTWRCCIGPRKTAARNEYLFDFHRINIYFLFCRTNSVRDLIFV